MLKNLIFLYMLVFLVGCCPCKKLVEGEKVEIRQTDTIFTERVIVDTVVKVKLEKELLYVSTIGTDTAFAETTYAYGMAWWDLERLNLKMWNKDTATVNAPKVVENTTHAKNRVETREKTVVKVEYRTRGFVKFLAWCGGAALLYLLVLLVIWICKKYFLK